MTPHVVVVGGGIAGLVAARDVARALPGVRVSLLEGGDRVGGKLRREEVGGHLVDVGAESLLARRPEGLDLVAELGLADDVVHPATASASIWSRGRLHPLPGGTLMGIPSDPEGARGLLTAAEVARAVAEEPWPGGALDGDVSVGEYVAARVGGGVVDRLVEPLLGGVYAGHARRLSLRATLPQVWPVATAGESLLGAARDASRRAAARAGEPVFAGLRGGVGRLPDVLAADLVGRGVEVRTGAVVRGLDRVDGGWSVTAGSTRDPERLRADALVLAVPARPAGRLLAPHSPDAAAALGGIEYASMAIVTLALPAEVTATLTGSGFLVPPVDHRTIKASTFSSAKWPAIAEATPGVAYLRASVGRAGEEAELQRPDEELVRVAAHEVGQALGVSLPTLLDAHVQRWGGALPQYAVGHLDRVARVRAALAGLPGVAVAGAAYDGVGVPAVVGTARAAAREVVTHLRERGPGGEE